MATYEIETDDGSVYQLETEEPITSTPKRSIVEDLTTPLVSTKDIQGSIVGQTMANSMPITQVSGMPIPPPFSQVIPPNIRSGLNAEMISQETSPLAIASNVGAGLGLLKQAKMLPQIMGKKYTLEQATKGVKALDTLRTTLGEAKKGAVAQVADKVVDNFKPTIPQQILTKIQDPIYEIEFTKSGAIKPTIGNLDKVKDALGDLLGSPRLWEEAPKKMQQLTKRAYGYVKTAMEQADEGIKEPIEAYHQFMKRYGLVNKSLRDTSGNVLEKRLRTTFSGGSEEQVKEAWKTLSEKSSEIKQIAKNMEKWATRQKVKKYGGYAVGTGAATYLFHNWLRDKVMGER